MKTNRNQSLCMEHSKTKDAEMTWLNAASVYYDKKDPGNPS